MVSKEHIKTLENIAKYSRIDKNLFSIITNDNYPNSIKVLAVKNPNLSTSALSAIIKRSNEFDKEVLMAALKHPGISRMDIIQLTKHHDPDVAIAAVCTRPELSGSVSICGAVAYSDNVELSQAALDVLMRRGVRLEAQKVAAHFNDLKDNPSLLEIALRSISNPAILHQLVLKEDDNIRLLLSKNHNLATVTVDHLIKGKDSAILKNLTKYGRLTEEQLFEIIDYVEREKDFELFTLLCQNNSLTSPMIEELLRGRELFYAKTIDSSMPYLAQETKESIMIDMERDVASSLSKNSEISIDMISAEYNIDIPERELRIYGLEGIDLKDKNFDVVALYDDLSQRVLMDYDVDELLRVADQQDIDPDIQKTVMLSLMNKQGNSIQTMNSLYNKFISMEDNLVSLVGQSSISYQKDSTLHRSPMERIKKMGQKALEQVSQTVSTMKQVISGDTDIKLTIKSKLPTNSMTDKNLSKEMIHKFTNKVKSINLLKKKDKKRGRRM